MLHGPEREAASEVEMQRARLRSKLDNAGNGHPAGELADDVEALKRLCSSSGSPASIG